MKPQNFLTHLLYIILSVYLLFSSQIIFAEKENHPKKLLINPSNLYNPSRYYTHIVSVKGGRTFYISGQVALNEKHEIVGKGNLRAQTKKAFQNLKTALESLGATPQDIVKLTIYIVNYKNQDLPILEEEGFNPLFGQYRGFSSTLLGIQALAIPGLLIEVEAVVVV